MAVVHSINGQLVLEDPETLEIITAIEKRNCNLTFNANIERIFHFQERSKILQKTPDEVVIVIINVDDIHGKYIADILMPNFNWQEIRDRNEIPFARGLANKYGMIETLALFDKMASDDLKKCTKLAAVVIDFTVAQIYELE